MTNVTDFFISNYMLSIIIATIHSVLYFVGANKRHTLRTDSSLVLRRYLEEWDITFTQAFFRWVYVRTEFMYVAISFCVILINAVIMKNAIDNYGVLTFIVYVVLVTLIFIFWYISFYLNKRNIKMNEVEKALS